MVVDPDRLLAGHVVLRTRTMEELHALVAGMEGRHARHVVGSGDVNIELRQASLGRLEVALHHANVTVEVEVARRRSDCFLVQFPLSGRIDLETDGRQFSAGPGTGIVMSPGQHVRRTGKPGWTLVFRAASDELRARLEARMGRSVSSPLAFHPLISAGADELLSYGLLVVEAIDRGIADPGSSLAAVLEDGFISLLFELQPHTLGRALSRSDPTGRAARIRAVEHLVDRSLDRPFTIAHLAAVAGCSARSLQKTFSDLCGIGPLEYVRRRRLSAARRLLETASRTSSVSDIATRTGFPHLARFASNYRTRYGELPSETLRRAAGQAARRVD